MFKKLRNRLILMNVGITAVLIFIVFSAIYIFASNSAVNRPTGFSAEISSPNNYYSDVFLEVLEREKAAAAEELLILLIVAGVAIELIVAGISYYLAEEAIKPVREAYESQKAFIANASHEIKTPLAVISANLEAAGIIDNRFIDNAVRETEKLAILNSELLQLAKTDAISEAELREVSVSEISKEVLASFEPRFGEREVELKIFFKGRTQLNVADFEQILKILLDNAIKYSKSKILVSVEEKRVSVRNDGVKIQTEDLTRIFERFYQVDKTAEGVGLGLSIAKGLTERNNWDISAKMENDEILFVLNF